MKCKCGAYANPLWQHCQKCGSGLKENYDDQKSIEEKIRELSDFDRALLKTNPDMLKAFKSSVRIKNQRQSGLIPESYTKTVHCKHCGGIKLWEGSPDSVKGCPWCLVVDQSSIACF